MSSFLSVQYLTAHGVQVTKPLKDWITRASFLAKTRGSDQARHRYEKWALYTIEQAIQSSEGVQATEWAKLSPVMPLNAPECHPKMLQQPEQAVSQSVTTSASREDLYREIVRRCPPELGSFVTQAFALYDQDVARGKRTYEQVSFVEMLNIVQNLCLRQKRADQQQGQQQYMQSLLLTQQTQAQLQTPASVAPSLLQSSYASCAPPPPAPRKEDRHSMNTTAESTRKKSRVEWPAIATKDDSSFFVRLAWGTQQQAATQATFVGQSTEMERMYSRYEPNPEDIRPYGQLVKAFAFVKKRAAKKEAQEGLPASRKYLSDQLKGMRQDLLVQNITNDFTVEVYEHHARLCLGIADIGEFNQCQAALKQLYLRKDVNTSRSSVSDFFCYRLAYLSLGRQYDSLSTELINYTTAYLKPKDQRGIVGFVSKGSVRRTLRLCAACDEGDCSTICHTLASFKNEMHFLVKIYLQRLRVGWLREMLGGMKGALSVRFIMSSLGFTPVIVGTSSSSGRATSDGATAFWLDGSPADAHREFDALISMLKIQLPADFDFDKEVKRETRHDGCSIAKEVPSVSADVALAATEAYITFLGTRKDASLA